ncbi:MULTISPECIES: hypothetical protein [unclassified Mesorhizobium]|uniref:hypothetical protein n=1 Tax=unclassified Mesorhizobium TaxID=325217 RepID=UPI001AECE58D|nr:MULTISPECIES: hypothetical protein [unclassified Mesorhizobium]
MNYRSAEIDHPHSFYVGEAPLEFRPTPLSQSRRYRSLFSWIGDELAQLQHFTHQTACPPLRPVFLREGRATRQIDAILADLAANGATSEVALIIHCAEPTITKE